MTLGGKRSHFADDCVKGGKWVDHFVPKDSQVRKVETLLHKNSGWLLGLKWIGEDEGVLLALGHIDNP